MVYEQDVPKTQDFHLKNASYAVDLSNKSILISIIDLTKKIKTNHYYKFILERLFDLKSFQLQCLKIACFLYLEMPS